MVRGAGRAPLAEGLRERERRPETDLSEVRCAVFPASLPFHSLCVCCFVYPGQHVVRFAHVAGPLHAS